MDKTTVSSKDKPGQPIKSKSSTPLIIVADDDPSVRLMLHHILEKEHFRVIEAENGQEAVNLCIKHRPHIVLLDAVMPELSGFVGCKLIKEHYPDMPVIIITSLDDDFSVEQAFQAGADDYITKPINWSVLKHRISHTLATTNLQDAHRSQSKLEQSIRNHNYNLLFKPRIDLDNDEIVCVESYFYKNNNQEFPLFEQLNSHSAVSIEAIENLIHYAFNKFIMLNQSHHNIEVLSLPLFPFLGQAELYSELLTKLANETGIDLANVELTTEQCSLADLKVLNLLQNISSLPVKLSINKFTFSLHTLQYLKTFRCDSIQLYLPLICSAFTGQPDHALLRQMLKPYKAFNLKLIAEHMETPEQLSLVKELGCAEAGGSFVG
ncbi:MAG: response regulator, partial [Gammaproteobacteria bacterium]|nr:response regulator [Gammaproteobacteria bacterium]